MTNHEYTTLQIEFIQKSFQDLSIKDLSISLPAMDGTSTREKKPYDIYLSDLYFTEVTSLSCYYKQKKRHVNTIHGTSEFFRIPEVAARVALWLMITSC